MLTIVGSYRRLALTLHISRETIAAVSGEADGTVIADRYAITGALGEGGMGRVLRAHDRKLDREVAIKLLAAHAIGDEKARQRMLREARAVAKLEHPGIVNVYDVGETDDGGAFIVMELVRGDTLRARLECGALSFAEAKRIVIACARALAFAHRAGAVHRDVKPDNVMIREDGRVALLDFGIAKTMSADASTLTEEGAVVGTPAYLAPEQARGEAVDARVDQFALAVTLYEMLANKLPWRGTSPAAIIAAMLRDAPEPASAARPSLPPALDGVVARALEKAPADRWPDLDAFADALEAVPAEASEELSLAKTVPQGLDNTDAATATQRTKRGKAKAGAVVAGLAAVALAAYVASAHRRKHAAPTASSSAPADAAPKVVRMIDLPPPATKVPAAAAAYKAGMEALHEDSYGEALRQFQQAVDLDPAMAEAHFGLSMTAAGTGQPEKKRAEYKRAAAAREKLSPRDQALLDALEPWLGSARPEPKEAARRLEALAAKRPNDAEIYRLIAVQYYGSPASLKWAERATALDPGDGQSWETKGTALLVTGRFDEARAAYDRCSAISVRSADCLWWRGVADRVMGKCEDFERDVQHATDRSAVYTMQLVGAMASMNRPEAALRDVAARTPEGYPPEDGRLVRAAFDTQFALFDGRFADARSLAKQEQALIDSHPRAASEYNTHYACALRFVQAALEMGDDAAAKTSARDFVLRSDAWTRDLSLSRGLDLTLFMARVGLRPKEFAAKRAAWIDARRADGAAPGQLWTYAWAAPATTPADASAALSALPRADRPASVASVLWSVSLPDSGIPDADIGRTYLLAGKLDRAIPYLRRAVANCGVFTSPFAHVHAARDLGRALEKKGDTQGACDAYAKVLARWGHAKPRSVTADEARARRAALHCP